jgi:hypothetical protein
MHLVLGSSHQQDSQFALFSLEVLDVHETSDMKPPRDEAEIDTKVMNVVTSSKEMRTLTSSHS